MALVIIIDLIVVCGLVWLTMTKGLERALPFFVFVVVFFPEESMIPLPGLFNLTTRRVVLAVVVGLYLIFGRDSTQAVPLKTTPLKYLILIHIFWIVLSTAYSVVPV